jgi:hypothetical protein
MGGPAFFFSKASANIRISSRHSRTSEVSTVSPSLISFPKASLVALFLRAWDGTRLPAALVRRRDRRLLHRPRRQRAGPRLYFRRRAGTALGGQAAHPRRGPTHRRQHRQASRPAAEQGRPRIQGQLRAGTGMLAVARECSVGTGTVQRIARWFHGGKN